jgi:predicted 2-oxoglutarate/Fe(II)-dependent dioxygenase YbiX
MRIGDPIGDVRVRTPDSAAFPLRNLAGRPLVVTLVGSAQHPAAQALLAALYQGLSLVVAGEAFHVVVSCDPRDEDGRTLLHKGNFLAVYDRDQAFSRRMGALDGGRYTVGSVVVDRAQRVAGWFPAREAAGHRAEVAERLASLAGIRTSDGVPVLAVPVLAVPDVVEPELVAAVRALLKAGSPRPTGVVEQVGEGAARQALVDTVKSRRDLPLDRGSLRDQVIARLETRLFPAMAAAFQFRDPVIDRLVIGRYAASEGGFFAPHRDDQSPLTAHRRFAASINLNQGEYQGGGLRFAEYSDQFFDPPTGAAMAFSASILHEVGRVTEGAREAVLCFLTDSAGAAARKGG